MNVEFSKRATADLRKLGEDSRTFGPAVSAAIERRIRDLIAHIADRPPSRPSVPDRAGVHVASLVRYPYRIFYRVFEDRVRILHIRHTARRQWTPTS